MTWQTAVQPMNRETTQTLLIDPSLWNRALKTAGRSGFYPADVDGISRPEMGRFLTALNKSHDPEINAFAHWLLDCAPTGFVLLKRPER
jgi:hypothetical protein